MSSSNQPQANTDNTAAPVQDGTVTRTDTGTEPQKESTPTGTESQASGRAQAVNGTEVAQNGSWEAEEELVLPRYAGDVLDVAESMESADDKSSS